MNKLTVTQFAKLLGVTARTANNWIDEGMPVTQKASGRGHKSIVDSQAALLWWAEHKCRSGQTHEQRLKKSQADKSELEVSELRGELVRLADVAMHQDYILSAAKSQWECLPAKLTPLIQAQDGNAKEIKKIIKDGVRQGLSELSRRFARDAT